MIPYIGVLSIADAHLLSELAASADRILEFGAGASTQLFAAYGRGQVTCIETEARWIQKTQRHLEQLGLTKPVSFRHVRNEDRLALPADEQFDLVFVDGLDRLRLRFAIGAWPQLTVGGVMCVHDTRRTRPHGDADLSDVQNVCRVIEEYSTEIDSIVLNQGNSNTTVIRKRTPLLYEDWMQTEGRTPAQMGLA